MTRPISLATLTFFGVAGATAFVASNVVSATAPRPTETAPKKMLVKTADPVDTIVAQLHRRFTDTRDVDFGFSRISRPKARMHLGPIMVKNDLLWLDWEEDEATEKMKDKSGYDSRLIRKKNDAYELKAEDGTWIAWDDAKEQMRPENPTETQAIQSLLKAKREIAIYTFGAFDGGRAERTRGPAYLRQKGPEAPESEKIKAVAETAWKGGVAELPGFRVRAEKVFAQASCVKCHNEMEMDEATGRPFSKKYKKGDALGLILIAEKL